MTIGVLIETSVATSLTYSHCQVEASPFEVLLSVEGRAGHVGAARCGENTHLVWSSAILLANRAAASMKQAQGLSRDCEWNHELLIHECDNWPDSFCYVWGQSNRDFFEKTGFRQTSEISDLAVGLLLNKGSANLQSYRVRIFHLAWIKNIF